LLVLAKSSCCNGVSIISVKSPIVKDNGKSPIVKSPIVKDNGKSPIVKSPIVKDNGESPIVNKGKFYSIWHQYKSNAKYMY
jgi:hypothetical protein